MLTGVIAPLGMEARTARVLTCGGWRVCRAGYGAERARAAGEALVAMGARRILVWGMAGGLDPDLATGAVLLPVEVRDEAGTVWRMTSHFHTALLRALSGVARISTVPLITTAKPVATPGDKATLARRSGAAAVDMEAAVVASIAAAAGVDCAVLRVVADTAHDTLPGVVLAARSQRFLAGEIALRLLFRPRDLGSVQRLARAATAACEMLSTCARTLAAAKALPE